MVVKQELIGDVLGALADPTRRRILDMLYFSSRATATALAADLPVSRQAVVKHLAVLERAGLVMGSRRGREVRYLLCPQPLDETAAWMARLADQWGERLHAIKLLAESPDQATARMHSAREGRQNPPFSRA